MSIGKSRIVSAGRARAGFTLIELMVAFSALLVVLLGFSRMLLSSHMASSTTHEATLAKEAARSMVEQLQAGEFDELYATYKAAGTIGSGFAVRGLEAPAGDADGLPGRILFPESGGVLSEAAIQAQYGWPVDMDGDGAFVTADVSTTYQVLPVVVRVEWRGSGGDGQVEFKTVIAEY
jgi:prepilin-type N-terminal cleavage/methylation domain-containing protein